MSAAPAINQLRGIAALVSAGAILSLTDSLAKLLTGTYPVGEILFFRWCCQTNANSSQIADPMWRFMQ